MYSQIKSKYISKIKNENKTTILDASEASQISSNHNEH